MRSLPNKGIQPFRRGFGGREDGPRSFVASGLGDQKNSLSIRAKARPIYVDGNVYNRPPQGAEYSDSLDSWDLRKSSFFRRWLSGPGRGHDCSGQEREIGGRSASISRKAEAGQGFLRLGERDARQLQPHTTRALRADFAHMTTRL